MKTLSERIKDARKAADMSQGELAKRVKVSRAAISQWENGSTQEIGGSNLLAASRALNVSPDWLARGVGDRTSGNSHTVAEQSSAYIYRNNRSVPVISWAQAGKWPEIMGQISPETTGNWIQMDGDFSAQSFGLVVDDSVITQESIPKGSTIIVDPSHEPTNGSLVVAKLPESDTATFKRLLIDGNIRYLQPLNTSLRAIEIDKSCVICGVVRRAITDFEGA
jgi:SOS-response transcriptional repressor LexA